MLDPLEACDDANLIDGDGCDSNCTPTGCGNGIVTAGEECDDGNGSDGDGCDPTCRLGPVFTPTPTPSPTASPTQTLTPTTIPTATPTAGRCVGDCDGTGSVTIGELLMMVNIA